MFGEDLLNGVEIRAVRREEEEPCAGGSDHIANGLAFVRAEIVEDHDIPRLQSCSSSRLPRSILAIAAGADFEHLALPGYWPDRSISLDKGVSHRDSLAKYAVAYFECMTWPLGGAGRAPGGP